MPDYKMTEADGKLLKSTATSIENDIRELSGISTVFRRDILSNIRSHWQGPAKEIFEKQFIAYVDAFDRFVKANDDLNQKLKAAGIAYEKADEAVRQNISKLKG